MDGPDSIKLGAVILAAGEGRRFGGNKALAQFEGVSFLELIAGNLKKIYCHPVITVAGSDAEKVTEECRRIEVDCVTNENWEAGQFSSLRTGLNEIKDVNGVIIALVDHPAVKFETYRDLKTSYEYNPEKILIPIYAERRGHPIIIPSHVIAEIIRADNQMSLRDILKSHGAIISQLNCDDPGILRDIDTREDLERI